MRARTLSHAPRTRAARAELSRELVTSTASPPAADARVALRDLTLEHWQVAGGLVEDQQSTAQRYARPLARGVLLVTHRREEVALPGRERRFGAGSALVGGQAYELRAGGPPVP